jgi:aldehyde:ferredoxin oxidoreductase
MEVVMPDGFFGKLLFVDLSQGTIEEKPLDPALCRDYLGGYGLGARVLYERIPPNAGPLGADNVLGFIPGLLTGTGVPFSGRFMVVAKSPLTGGWGDANCGGRFGPALRATGFDGLFVSGLSPRPVYLLVDDEGKIELRDAAQLWGLDTEETEQKIKREVGGHAQVVSIGPAGENCVLVASIMTDGGRAAARSGLGAVMGAKQLKAVVVRGSRRVSIHDKRALDRHSKRFRRPFKESPRLPKLLFRLMGVFAPLMRRFRLKFATPSAEINIYIIKEYGTCSGLAFFAAVGNAPVKNWQGVSVRDFPMSRSARISDNAVIQHKIKKYYCRHCLVGCGGILRIEGQRYDVQTHKPEYETLAAFGPLLLNDDLESIAQANSLCDRYGLDTISTGTIVAFALECAEKGLIRPEDADGLDLSWGNVEVMVELVEKIARREGIGDLLADGVQRAAEKIGPGARELAMHVGGQELAMHDPRYEPLIGLAYQVDPTPARHTTANCGVCDVPTIQQALATENETLSGRYEYEAKGAHQALMNRYLQVVTCSGLCLFALSMGDPPVREWINAATGWDLDDKELMRAGHRIQVLRYIFNLREGIRPTDWRLPPRVAGRPPQEEGPLEGVTLDMEAMTRSYYRAMGFDEESGVPGEELLEALGLSAITAGQVPAA